MTHPTDRHEVPTRVRSAHRAALLSLLLTLGVGSAASAQGRAPAGDGEVEQNALRARWRPVVDVGLRLALGEELYEGGTRIGAEDKLAPAASVGFSLYRAVLPGLDLGGRVGLTGPQTTMPASEWIQQTCPTDYRLAADETATVGGGTLDVTVGARARVFGAHTPFHLVGGVGLGLRALSGMARDDVYCGRYDGSGAWVRVPAQGEPRGAVVSPSLAGPTLPERRCQ